MPKDRLGTVIREGQVAIACDGEHLLVGKVEQTGIMLTTLVTQPAPLPVYRKFPASDVIVIKDIDGTMPVHLATVADALMAMKG